MAKRVPSRRPKPVRVDPFRALFGRVARMGYNVMSLDAGENPVDCMSEVACCLRPSCMTGCLRGRAVARLP